MKMFNPYTTNSPNFNNFFSPLSPSFRPTNPPSPKHHKLRNNQSLEPQLAANLVNSHQYIANQSKKEDVYQNSSEQQNFRQPWQSKLSLMLSTVSVPEPPRPQIDAQRIFKIENNITQQQKITLLQELSQILDTKNLYEHYILAAPKDQKDTTQIKQGGNVPNSSKGKNVAKTEADDSKDSYVPIQVSAPILKRNEELHLRLKQIQVKQQIFGPAVQQISEQQQQKNKAVLQQIIKIRELNSNLKNDIAQKIKNSVHQNANQNSRYVTFLPQDRQKHFEQKKTIQAQYRQLQDKYNQLLSLNQQTPFRLTPEENQELQNLKRQNQLLLQEVSEMLRQKQNYSYAEVNELRTKINQNERQKQTFFKEFQKFKEMMANVKQENQRLRYELAR